jgi:hypothetical protein
MYKCRYFAIKELVNPALLKKIGENIAWITFDERLLRMADAIRSKFGPCTVNTDGLTDCGLRDPQSTTGAKYSMHKIGRALDLHIRSIELAAGKIKDATERKKFKIREYNKIREQLMANHEFDCLSFEHNISWLHVDTANRANRLYNP